VPLWNELRYSRLKFFVEEQLRKRNIFSRNG